MKKITSFMLMLLCAMTAWAQTLPATDKAFTVVAEGHNSGVKPGWAINNGKTAMVSFGNTAISSNEQKYFAFVQHDGKVYLYSVWAQKFVQKDMSLSASLPIDDIKVENVNGGKFYFKYDDAHNMNIGGSKQLAPDGWNTKDGGNQYTLTEVADFDPTAALAILSNSCTITYNFKYNGQVVATQTTEVTKGAGYPAFTSLPWGAVATVPTGTANEDKTFEIECTVDTSVLPFVPSATYGDANMKWYYLKFHSDNGYYLHHDEGQNHIDLGSKAIDNNNKDAYAWAFIGNPFDGYKIVNRAKGNGYILSSSTTMAGTTGSDTWPIMTNEENLPEGNNTYWIPTSSSHHENGFFLAQKDYPDNRMNDRGKLAYWTAGAGSGSTFWVEECPIEITYTFTYNGQALDYTQTVNAFVGEEYPDITVSFPFGLSATKPEGTVAADATTFTIALEENLPFEFAASYDAIGDKWYYLSIGQSAHLLYHVEGADHIALDRTAVDKNNKDAYLWAFVGSPFDGYKLVNRAKGDGWILSSSTNTFDNNTGGNTYPIMTSEKNLDGKNTYWIPTASENLGDGGFYLAQKDANNGYNKMNNRDGKLAYWNQSADHGSTFKVRHMDAIEPVVFEWTATTEWTSVDAADCTSSLVWDNQYTGGIKYIEGSIAVDTPVKADVTFTYTHGDKRLNIRGVEIIDANGNVVAGDYHVGQAGGAHIDNRYRVQVAEAGTYTVRCYATEGEYQLNGNTNNDTFDNTNGRIRVDMTKFNAGELSNNVTFTAKYATLYLGYKVAIPNGVKAYVAVSTNKGRVQFEEVTGVIPAVTPVLLENVGNSNTYEFAYTTNPAETVETNLLKGSIANRYVTEDAYVLTADANDENGVCFGKATKNQQNNASWLNNANKAYLPATSVTGASGSTSLRFDFDGITTGVEEVEIRNEKEEIYDLTGRRVNEITKAGVYIINGKKTLVK